MSFRHNIFESNEKKEKRLCLEALQALEKYIKSIGYDDEDGKFVRMYTDEEIEAAAEDDDYLWNSEKYDPLLVAFCLLDYQYFCLCLDDIKAVESGSNE
jgi:hypothetical protein